MNPLFRDKNNHADDGDLQGTLRQAVDKIKAQPLPADAQERSLERAKALTSLAVPSYRGRRRSVLALAAIAAALLFGMLLLPNLGQKDSQRHLMAVDSTASMLEGDEDKSKSELGDRGTSLEGYAEQSIRFKATRQGDSNGGKDAAAGDGTPNGPMGDRANISEPKNESIIPPVRSRNSTVQPSHPSPERSGGLGGGLPRGMGAVGGAGLNGGGFGLGGGLAGLGGGQPGPGGPVGFPGQGRDDEAAPVRGQSRSATSNASADYRPSDAKPAIDQDENKSRPHYGFIDKGEKIGLPTSPVTVKNKDRKQKAQKNSGNEEDALNYIEADNLYKKLTESDKGKEDKKENKERPDGQKLTKKPQVYQRRNSRPSFARVYVGDQTSLELVSLQVTVTVEGPRARTVVDHIFHNPHNRQLEGTFEYPLPAGASPSYFAMFLGQTRDTVPPRFNPKGQPESLPRPSRFGPEFFAAQPGELVKQVSVADWGILQEARVVNRAKGLETYEEVVRGRIDPALLEYAGGNTFSGRVFPIPAKGYNRVLIAYEELLPSSGDQVVYRYPLPDCKLQELEFHLQASPAECKEPRFEPQDAGLERTDSRLVYSRIWQGEGPGGDVAFAFTPAQRQIQAISGRQNENSPLYLYARIKPELKVEKAKPFADRAVFLLDTSLSEHPERFALNVKLLKKVLESDADLKQFNILTFNVGCAWVEPNGWLNNTAGGRETAFSRLDGLVLEGATDFNAALTHLAKPPAGDDKTPVDIFVLSDGQITWGEQEVGPLVARFEQRCPFPTRFHCYRTGQGADNLELYEALTRRGGGIFNCFTQADLKQVAVGHRSQCLKVDRVRFAGAVEASDVLVAGRQAAVFPGGDLIVAAKMPKAGSTNLVVEGTFQGEKWVQEYPIEITGYSDLAPRGWGEIAVASLLALNNPKLDDLVTAYCQQFSIGSRVASFLVLENEADYKRFNLEDERGKTHAGDLGTFLDEAWRNLAQALSSRAAFARFLDRIETRVNLQHGPNGAYVAKLLALLKDDDYELPVTEVAGKLLHKGEVPAAYLAKRDADIREAGAYLTEARRRSDTGDASGAVRALSSIIELYPARGDALRLVGYRLLDSKLPVPAANLFRQVQAQRPFEPHSYRDLARSLEDSGRYGLAALQYEIVLAGTWHNRFHDSLKMVVLEEYTHMMREAIAKKAVSPDLANHFGDRLEKIDPGKMQADLRVTISWNTDATDVDLWVIEPNGEKCFYSHRNTRSGGELTEDQTQGYGPERYQIKNAQKGAYRVLVHYFRPNPNLLAGETHVNVVITRHAGTPQEKMERRTVILRRQNEEVEVCQVGF
ncbi:MAG: VIT domain-containing protein [Gemmataceae bacterium]